MRAVAMSQHKGIALCNLETLGAVDSAEAEGLLGKVTWSCAGMLPSSLT